MRLHTAKTDVKTNVKTSLFIAPLLAVVIGGMLMSSATASTLVSSTAPLDYKLPKSVQKQCVARDICPEIEVKYLSSNQAWINKIVNARVNDAVVNLTGDSDAPIDEITVNTDIKAVLDDFTLSQFIDMPEESEWGYSLSVEPKDLGSIALGQNESFMLFEVNSYVFTGGAHGMAFSENLIFDPSTKQQVTLTDMLLADKESQFKAQAYTDFQEQAYAAYKSWVATLDEDVSSYEEDWPFTLSDNVTLTEKGIDILYQQYEIAPYAYGMPVLSIPYSKLRGIIKPRFMPK